MFHTGLLDEYWLALKAGAAAAFQFPSCAVLPAILMVSPGTVTTRSVKDTETAVGQAVPIVLAMEVVVVRRVVGVGVVVSAAMARSTTGSPETTLTQV